MFSEGDRMIVDQKNDNDEALFKKQKFKAQRILYCAPSGMGKTYLMVERCLQYIKEKRYDPHRILIFATNYMTDSSLRPLIKKCE